MKQNKMEGALEDFNKAINYDPKHAEAFCNRANLFFKKGKNGKAREDMKKAFTLNPEVAQAFKEEVLLKGKK